MRFIPWSGLAASAPQDRLRKCSLASVEAASHRHVPRATEGQHDDCQWPESLGQKRHAPGVDRKSLTEWLAMHAVGRKSHQQSAEHATAYCEWKNEAKALTELGECFGCCGRSLSPAWSRGVSKQRSNCEHPCRRWAPPCSDCAKDKHDRSKKCFGADVGNSGTR